MDKCWQTIGVWSLDGPSCPELTRVVHCRNCEVYQEAGRQMLHRTVPEGYQDERAAMLADPPPADRERQEAALAFRLGAERFAMPLGIVIEVLDWRTVRPVPHRGEDALLGLVNVRGELHLCMSLETLFGWPRPRAAVAPPRGRMVAIGSGTTDWVVPVDETLGLPHVSMAALEPVPATLLKSEVAFVRGLFRYRDAPIGLLDGELLLGALGRRLT